MGHLRPLALCAVLRLSRGLWRSAPPMAEGLQPAAPLRSMLSTDSSRTRCPPEAPRLGRAPHRNAHRGQGSGVGPTTFCYSKFAGRTQSIYLRAPPGFLQQCGPNWRRFSIGGSRSAEGLLCSSPDANSLCTSPLDSRVVENEGKGMGERVGAFRASSVAWVPGKGTRDPWDEEMALFA